MLHIDLVAASSSLTGILLLTCMEMSMSVLDSQLSKTEVLVNKIPVETVKLLTFQDAIIFKTCLAWHFKTLTLQKQSRHF